MLPLEAIMTYDLLSDLVALFQLRLSGVHNCGEWQVMLYYMQSREGKIGI